MEVIPDMNIVLLYTPIINMCLKIIKIVKNKSYFKL